MIIAIDGVAASGKGTLAEFLAKHYKCRFLPTGNLYRIVAKNLIERNVNINEFVLTPSKINLLQILDSADVLDANLSSDIVSEIASKIAKVNVVRQVLTQFQRQWIRKHKTAVVEGRDIGTVVWPEAEVKLFLDADLKIRTKRRVNQLCAKGRMVSEGEIYNSLLERDKRDRSRELAPMKMAQDAILLDTTNLTIKEVQHKALELIEKKIDNSCGKV